MKNVGEKSLFTHSVFIHFQHAAGADVNNNNIYRTQTNETSSEPFYDFHFEISVLFILLNILEQDFWYHWRPVDLILL